MKEAGECSILVVGGYGFDNLGDDLILRSALGQLRKSLTDPQITILSNNPQETQTRHRGETVTFSPEALVRQIILRLLCPVFESYRKYKLKIPGDTFRRQLNSLLRSDLVVSLGGGYLNDYSSFLTHFRLVELVFFGLCRKPIVLYAHEVGPLRRATLRPLAKLAFRFVTYATVRDKPSLQVLQELGISKERFVHTADESWVYEPRNSLRLVSNATSAKNGISIAVNVMPSEAAASALLTKRSSADFENVNDQILSAIAAHVQDLGARLRRVVFLSMADGDTKLGSRLRSLLGKQHSLEILCDLDSQYHALAECDLLVGMRLHPIIMAAQMNVRPLAIALLPKVSQVMSDLGVAEYVVEGFPFDKERFGDRFRRICHDREKAIVPALARVDQRVHYLRARAMLNAAIAGSAVVSASRER